LWVLVLGGLYNEAVVVDVDVTRCVDVQYLPVRVLRIDIACCVHAICQIPTFKLVVHTALPWYYLIAPKVLVIPQNLRACLKPLKCFDVRV